MTFIARLKDFSPVWRLWHEQARVSGRLHDVLFFWEPGNVYRSKDSLTAAQIAVLHTHPSVVMEAVETVLSASVPVVAAAERPVAMPVPAPVPRTPLPVNAFKPRR
jgi:hypothetical protein